MRTARLPEASLPLSAHAEVYNLLCTPVLESRLRQVVVLHGSCGGDWMSSMHTVTKRVRVIRPCHIYVVGWMLCAHLPVLRRGDKSGWLIEGNFHGCPNWWPPAHPSYQSQSFQLVSGTQLTHFTCPTQDCVVTPSI